MAGKPRRLGFLERAAEVFDLPADAVAGVPRLELLITGKVLQISLA